MDILYLFKPDNWSNLKILYVIYTGYIYIRSCFFRTIPNQINKPVYRWFLVTWPTLLTMFQENKSGKFENQTLELSLEFRENIENSRKLSEIRQKCRKFEKNIENSRKLSVIRENVENLRYRSRIWENIQNVNKKTKFRETKSCIFGIQKIENLNFRGSL